MSRGLALLRTLTRVPLLLRNTATVTTASLGNGLPPTAAMVNGAAGVRVWEGMDGGRGGPPKFSEFIPEYVRSRP